MRTTRRMTIAGATAVAVALTLALAPNAYAAATGAAYVWANDATASSYTPDLTYQYNSSGAANTVVRHSAGFYTVNLPNLGAGNGTVLVTAYGATSNYCKVSHWGPSGSTQTVDVRCFTRLGDPADTLYTMSFTNQLGAKHAWLWAEQESRTDKYSPQANYQANSLGKPNTVQRISTGNYYVAIPVAAEDRDRAGHAEVTGYGSGPEHCTAEAIGTFSSATVTEADIQVACFTPGGAPVDTKFVLTWVADGNVIGQAPFTGSPSGFPSVYALERTGLGSAVRSGDQLDTVWVGGGGTVSVVRTSLGHYIVNVPISQYLGSGNVQVTDESGFDRICSVESWSPSVGIVVDCYRLDGFPADSPFFVSFVGARIIA